MTATYDAPPDYDEPPTGRLPPQDLDAERSVLGGQQLSRDAIAAAVEAGITPAAFYRPAHGTIQEAILGLYGRNEPVDPITLGRELDKRGELHRVGGIAYLHTLVTETPTAANVEYYAQIVVEKARLRRLIEAATRIMQMGYAGDGEIADILDAAQAEMQAATRGAVAGDERVQWLDGMLEDYVASMDAPEQERLPLPYRDLDALLMVEPGDFVVVAARPAVGKSVVLLDIARHVAIRHGRPALVSSMEMSRPQLTQRIIAAEAKVGLHKIKTRDMDADDRGKVERAIARIAGALLVVDDGPAATLMQLRSRLRWLQGQDRLPAVVCVDYLQIMKAVEKKGQNRTGEVDALSRGLKELALEFRTVIVAASQLNRQVEQRTDKTPMLADLRESGSIEADANAVILLHREDAYDKSSPRSGEMDLIVAKNRQGPTATITVAFQGHYARAMDLAPSN